MPGVWQSECDVLQHMQGEMEKQQSYVAKVELGRGVFPSSCPEPGRVCDPTESAFRPSYC